MHFYLSWCLSKWYCSKSGSNRKKTNSEYHLSSLISSCICMTFHNQYKVRTREKVWATNTSASVTELLKKNVITGDNLSQAPSEMPWMEQGYTKPAPSTSTGNGATIFGAYRHCHTLKMINEEIFLQHLDTASAYERHSRRDSKLSVYSDLSCHGCKCL